MKPCVASCLIICLTVIIIAVLAYLLKKKEIDHTIHEEQQKKYNNLNDKYSNLEAENAELKKRLEDLSKENSEEKFIDFCYKMVNSKDTDQELKQECWRILYGCKGTVRKLYETDTTSAE